MPTFDTLIAGGRLVDGSGNPWRYADVAVTDGRVADITPPGFLDPADASETVDAAGHVVCPGFIDIQSHSIVPFLTDRRSVSKVTQGVTTEIMGEGWTPAPFGGRIAAPFSEVFVFSDPATAAEWNPIAREWARFGDWLGDLDRRGVSVNVGSFIGHGTVREFARGFELGDATADEIATMRRVVAEAMEDGAFGVATALIYPPSCYAGLDELTAIMEVVAARRGVHITHMRSEDAPILSALDETLEIARRTGVATEIYHLKVTGEANWPLMHDVIARIDAARADGIDVTCDMYPYVASGTGLASVLPPWAEADGKLWDNLSDPAARARMRRDIERADQEWENIGASAGPDRIVPIGLLRPEHAGLIGKSLAEIAAMRNQDWIDAAMDLLLAERQGIFTYYFEMGEDNLALQMRQPWMKFSTDAGGLDPARIDGIRPEHPRAYGTYPRILGKYVRDEGVLPLEDAIRKMTSAVADRLGLVDRGLLRPGMAADIVVFDPEAIRDRATFANAHQLSVGVRDVWVNGTAVLRDAAHTGATPGKWLKHRGPGNHAAA